MDKKTGEGYEAASAAFDTALEKGDLGEHEAFAYNMRGTFRYLRGENSDALEDLTKSVEIDPSLTQSYIKRASMHLELGKSWVLRSKASTNTYKANGKLQPVISSKPQNSRKRILTSIITELSCISYSVNLQMQPRTIRNPLI